MKRNKTSSWLFLTAMIIFMVGAGIFLYPVVSQYLEKQKQKEVIRTYRATVENQDKTAIMQAWEEAEVYNENLTGDPVSDPFIAGSGYVLPDNYENVLNPNGDGVMGYVEIPKISVYLPIYHGTDETVLEKGAGHLEMTALPIGGKNRHSVISAHRGLPGAELFTRLDEVEKGDQFYIHVLDMTLAYEVDQIEIILPEKLAFLSSEENKDRVTLLTCTPYAVNTHRLLVRGERVPYEKKDNGEEQNKWASENAQRKLPAGIGLLGMMSFIVLTICKHVFRKKD